MGDARRVMPQLDTEVVAGGKIVMTLGAGPTAPAICMGSGAPTLSAPKGSQYFRTDGSTTTNRQYIATDAVGTWTAVTTAA